MDILKRTLLFGITAVCAALGLSATYMLSGLFPNINPILMNIIYFTVPALLVITAVIVFDLISPIVHRERDSVYKSCLASALAIAVLGTAAVSGGMQYLYKTVGKGGTSNVVLMIDISSSMANAGRTRLKDAKASAEELVNQANKNDKIAVVAFDHTYNNLTNGFITITNDESKTKLKNIINNMPYDENSGTDLDGALLRTYNDIVQSEESAGVFVISDAEGEINNATMEKYINKGDVTVSTLLITEDIYDATYGDSGIMQLTRLAEKTNGMFKSVSDTTQLSGIYKEMFADYKVKNQTGLYAPRDISDFGSENIYLLIIQLLFYLMPGMVMAAAYTILLNRRDVRVWYCVLGGVICAVGVVLNCAFLQIPLLNAAFFVLMYPAVVTGGYDGVVREEYVGYGGVSDEYVIK